MHDCNQVTEFLSTTPLLLGKLEISIIKLKCIMHATLPWSVGSEKLFEYRVAVQLAPSSRSKW